MGIEQSFNVIEVDHYVSYDSEDLNSRKWNNITRENIL